MATKPQWSLIEGDDTEAQMLTGEIGSYSVVLVRPPEGLGSPTVIEFPETPAGFHSASWVAGVISKAYQDCLDESISTTSGRDL